MSHADLIARLRDRGDAAAGVGNDPLAGDLRAAADALEAFTSQEAVERGARALHARGDHMMPFDGHPLSGMYVQRARAVLDAAAGGEQ